MNVPRSCRHRDEQVPLTLCARDPSRAIEQVPRVLKPEDLAIRRVEERASHAVEVEPPSFETARVPLRLSEDVLWTHGDLLCLDDADDLVAEPERIVRGPFDVSSSSVRRALFPRCGQPDASSFGSIRRLRVFHSFSVADFPAIAIAERTVCWASPVPERAARSRNDAQPGRPD